MPDLAAVLAHPVLEVAPRLLGAVVRHGDVAVRLTEVEAYAGADDPGSHAYRGRTARNEVMFGPPGHLYVYFTYGMHHCCNVVTGEDGVASAVLLRAGEVVAGVDVAALRRPRSSERDLARGPARLCSVLGITHEQDGTDLATGPVTLELGEPMTGWQTGPRVGLRGAPERPWRFWLPGERSVSTYRPATPRPTRAPDLGS
ncbi:DNA-3-methyladenine glycosylase [Nocardioides coralli]|uniref:DNA-3-methyladenine glycosylase n=1 Tax=Nocardioides coralli TaxID=2872154 RepID=UPI001CA4534C|nr:DNA-3-methyladenine glycosylase [Nocardioides coralli]QZY30569.1 DNA-3-methyladenine glycosylase [Nocardioides coralli]